MYFIVIVRLPKDKDGLTKMVHFITCHTNISAVDTADLFLDHIFRLHGLPESVVSDRGSIFISHFWREAWNSQGLMLTYSTAYHPQTDGQSERSNVRYSIT